MAMAEAIKGTRHFECTGGFLYLGPVCRLRAW